MIIRATQMEAFKQASLDSFHRRSIVFLQEFFPVQCARIGTEHLSEFIRYARDRAMAHSFATERSLRLYLALAMMMGIEFDVDFQLPWIQEMMGDVSAEEVERIDLLWSRSMTYIDQVAGTNNEHVEAVAERIGAASFCYRSSASDDPAFHVELIESLAKLYPQKAAYSGEIHLGMMAKIGIEEGKSLGISSGTGFVLYVTLKFLFGTGFLRDPRFRWRYHILEHHGALEWTVTMMQEVSKYLRMMASDA